MDFVQLQSGILQLAISAAAALNISFAPITSTSPETNITYPGLIESYNLPSEIETKETAPLQDLSSVTKADDVNLKMVVKGPEVEKEILVTVELPTIVYTVRAPSPKPLIITSAIPSTKPSSRPEISEPEPSKKPETAKKEEVKVEEKKEVKSPELSAVPVTTPSTPNAEKLFQMVNDHRSKLGKAPFEKDGRLCKIAEARAPAVNTELKNGTLHKGFKDLNLPYWATENIASYQTIQENFNFWISDYIHRAAIEGDHKFSCVACTVASCSQIFTSFTLK